MGGEWVCVGVWSVYEHAVCACVCGMCISVCKEKAWSQSAVVHMYTEILNIQIRNNTDEIK